MKNLKHFCQIVGISALLFTTIGANTAFAMVALPSNSQENLDLLPPKIAQTIESLKEKIPFLNDYNIIRLSKDGDSLYSPNEITVMLNKTDDVHRTDNIFSFDPKTHSLQFFMLGVNIYPQPGQIPDQKAIEVASQFLVDVMGEQGYTPLQVWRETLKGPNPSALPPKVNFKKISDDPSMATYIQVSLDSEGSVRGFQKKTKTIEWDQWYDADLNERAVPK